MIKVEHEEESRTVVLTVDYDELEMIKDGLSALAETSNVDQEGIDYLDQMVQVIKESY